MLLFSSTLGSFLTGFFVLASGFYLLIDFFDAVVVVCLHFCGLGMVRGINWSIKDWRWLVFRGILRDLPAIVCVVTMLDVHAVLVLMLAFA